MNAAELVSVFESRGVYLSETDGKLIIDAPTGVLDDDDRALLKRHKHELLALLVPTTTLTEEDRAVLDAIDTDRLIDAVIYQRQWGELLGRPVAKALEPPVGCQLYFQDSECRPCSAGEAAFWTWAGAPEWYRVLHHPIPASARRIGDHEVVPY